MSQQGARPAPGAVYVDALTRVELVCARDHACNPVPTRVIAGGSVCSRCSGKSSAAAAEDFHTRLAALGSQLAPGQRYQAVHTTVVLVCTAGHHYPVTPTQVRAGHGQCPECVLAKAAAPFWDAVAASGARPAPGAVYRNQSTRVPLVCANGHDCAPLPWLVKKGGGVCNLCTRGTRAAAAARFLEALAARGFRTAPDGAYRGWDTPVDVLCDQGHPMSVRPSTLHGGGGACTTCAPTRVVAAARPRRRASGPDPDYVQRFWARVAELGATPAPGATYVNSATPVDLLCRNGHRVSPRPGNLLAGQGPCARCAGNDLQAAAAAFAATLTDKGFRLAPGAEYRSAKRSVSVICPQGHRTAVYPTSVQQGGGGCAKCTKNYDRLYLMTHPAADAVKVGVASGERRLRQLRCRGYHLVEQWTGLDHVDAVRAEGSLHRWWRGRGWAPVAASPVDGRTETAPLPVLAVTRDKLRELLGDPAALPTGSGTGAGDVPARVAAGASPV